MSEGSVAIWGTPPARHPQRRLVLPPIFPVLTLVVASPGSGSRFGVLGEVSEEDGEISLAEEVAWRGLEDVPRVLPLGQGDGLSNGELLAEFWSKISYPTTESRSWERKAAAAEPVEVLSGLRARSLSPARSEGLVAGRRPASSSPPGLRMPKPPMRMKAWKGPLPPRRITLPAILADFVAIAKRGPAALEAVGGHEVPRQPTERSRVPGPKTAIAAVIRPRFEPAEAGSSVGPQAR
jgi:hypothetical protein